MKVKVQGTMKNSWVRILKITGLLAVALFAFGSQAKADGMQFTFTGGPGQSISFTVPIMPTPQAFTLGDSFLLYNVPGEFDGQSVLFSLKFYTPGNPNYQQWGISMWCAQMTQPFFFGTGGAPLFTGSTNAPTLIDTDGLNFPIAWTGPQWAPNTVTGEMSAVPEPGTLLLLGMGGMALLGYRRKRSE